MSDRLPEIEALADLIEATCDRFGIDLLGKHSRDRVAPIVLASGMHVEDNSHETYEPEPEVCSQTRCDKVAERLVHWPDGRKLPMCASCAAWASKVLRATGVEPQIDMIDP